MPFIENNSVQIYYEDHGAGKPVVLIHGWPVSGQMWENQVHHLAGNGFRCITYDRRGFGQSDKPWAGYEYDTFAQDLDTLINTLNLTDVTLIGFSMGGGEVVRYLSKYGSSRVSKAVLVSSVVPGLLKSEDNPDGAPQELFDGMVEGILKDRQAFMQDFGKNFYGVGMIKHPVSSAVVDWHWGLCMKANLKATIDCVRAFSETNFTDELNKIDVPLLLIHGDSDQIVPIGFTSERVKKLLPAAEFKVYAGAPHGLYISEKHKLNNDLLFFLNS